MKHIFVFVILSIFIACGSEDTETATPVNAATTPSAAKVETATNYSTASITLKDGVVPNAESPNIEVTVNGLNSGMAYLIGFYQGKQYRQDSTQVKAGGKVLFKRDKPYNCGLMYLVFSDNSNLQMLIDADQTFKMTTQKTNLVGAMQVEGSLENELLYKNLKFEAEHRKVIGGFTNQIRSAPADQKEALKAKRDEQMKKREQHLADIFSQNPNAFFTSFKQSGQNPVVTDVYKPNGDIDTIRRVWLYRNAFWDNVNFNDERLMYTPVISNKLKRYITELTPQHPDSIFASSKFLVDKVLDKPKYFQYFANWIVLKYDPKETTLMDPQAVYVNMIETYWKKELATWSSDTEIQALQQRAYEMSASLVGKPAPDVKSTDPNGKTRSIYEMKDDYILVYMYNPDCEHCAKETPKLVQYWHENKPKGVGVFAIAIDTEDKKWKDYIKKNKMPWENNVHDPTNRSIYAKYFVDVTPELYVINPDRKIVGKNLKVDQVNIIIERDKRNRAKG